MGGGRGGPPPSHAASRGRSHTATAPVQMSLEAAARRRRQGTRLHHNEECGRRRRGAPAGPRRRRATTRPPSPSYGWRVQSTLAAPPVNEWQRRPAQGAACDPRDEGGCLHCCTAVGARASGATHYDGSQLAAGTGLLIRCRQRGRLSVEVRDRRARPTPLARGVVGRGVLRIKRMVDAAGGWAARVQGARLASGTLKQGPGRRRLRL